MSNDTLVGQGPQDASDHPTKFKGSYIYQGFMDVDDMSPFQWEWCHTHWGILCRQSWQASHLVDASTRQKSIQGERFPVT